MLQTRDTNLAGLIETADLDARYDQQAKKLISNVMILSWILKETLKEYKGLSVAEVAECIIGKPEISKKAVHQDMPDRDDTEAADRSVEGMNTESNSMNEHTVHYDIRFKAKIPGTNDAVDLIINVEVQVDASSGRKIIRRGFYYCTRMVSEQYGTEFTDDHYEKIKKVVSIWICPNPTKKRRDSIVVGKLNGEVIYGEPDFEESDFDLAEVIVISLNDESETSEQSIISVLLSGKDTAEQKKDVLKNEFDIPMTVEFTKEVDDMATLSSAFRKSVEVRKEQEVIRKLAEKMLNNKEPVEKIEDYCNVSEDYITELAESIGVKVVYGRG